LRFSASDFDASPQSRYERIHRQIERHWIAGSVRVGTTARLS
jgi:hypothetical protein